VSAPAAASKWPAPASKWPAPASKWIVSPQFDLTWFFGGAALSLAAVALLVGVGAPVVALWWVWLLAFDGPHIGAAFTRTYLDRREWRARPGVLVRGLLVFAVGPAFLAAGLATGSERPFALFLGLAALYGYYHVVRQHYGFLALYQAVNGDRAPLDRRLDAVALYAGLWAPYVYFILSHPRARRLLEVPNEGPGAALANHAAGAAVVVWTLAMIALVARIVVRAPAINRPKVAYLLVTLPLYAVIYFVLARLEPLYTASAGPDQDFLMLSILVTVFHNVQYLGLVWFHNRNRYADAVDAGPATWVNRSALRFLAVCGLFSLVVYALTACWTDVFPGCRLFASGLGPVTASQIGLCLWWGLALQHYYLDQRIWRISGDAELKRNLRLA
jgi:hypothetical protein